MQICLHGGRGEGERGAEVAALGPSCTDCPPSGPADSDTAGAWEQQLQG